MKTASKRKSKAIVRRRPGPQKAIVLRVPTLPEHRYDLDGDQVELIKRTIAKGATDDELKLFLWVAKRHRLDPFTRQLHIVKRFDSATNQNVATIQVGIDGYRQMASRYQDFGSVSEAEYGPMSEINRIQVPEWARVKVLKKGMTEPSVGVAYWREYAPDLADKKAFMWRKMPRHMLAKCAEAIALRKAYPDLADIYTDDEMARTTSEHTESGRQIITGAEQRYLDREKDGLEKLSPAQREVVERKMAEAKSSQPVQEAAKGAEIAGKDQASRPPTVEMVSFPYKPDGDVAVRADQQTATLLGLKRLGAEPGQWLVKYEVLPKFYDVCRNNGVTVKGGE